MSTAAVPAAANGNVIPAVNPPPMLVIFEPSASMEEPAPDIDFSN
jgi:hypothetical protein